ncbi:uncharacterized protein LOC103026875 isoform X2 [Astyanax mexicanus]|uniref:uncharacterized protein LOC103026875 isoform X2 n=1 Tax=Astyanax mexicanus TaxID=7994 RepID=UPI0020CAAFB3|nr:uncharacterized protein LOC103026875 isoform X2 [Astyanax mexicanus]
MPSFWILILFLYKICSAETVGNTEPLVVSVKAGEAVTLNCTSALINTYNIAYWFKHRLEHKPQEVGFKLKDKQHELQNPFKDSKSGFELKDAGSGFSLSIKQVQKEDEGMYFCGSVGMNKAIFSTGTFVAVSDPPDISVLPTPVSTSVPPEEAVNLQCTVLSEIRSAELRVFWIRSAAGSSFPEIIFTHHSSSSSSSSRQCEISSSKHSSVYNFSPNIPNNHHAATYYCAVETCGRIIVGSRTALDLSSAKAVGSSDSSVVSVKAGEAVTLTCSSALTDTYKTAYWFKHRLEHKPQEVGYKLYERQQELKNPFKDSKSGFELKEVGSGVSLSIKQVQKEDEGMYFCGSISENSVKFSTGTFLAVSDPSDISVLQTPALQSVPPGEAVNLQCTVLSEIRSAELRVFWIRSAAGSSFPEIIFTHHNSSSSSSSSRQCEISSSKHSSVYNFSKIIASEKDAGTFYCGVEICGRIIIGNGTTTELSLLELDSREL